MAKKEVQVEFIMTQSINKLYTFNHDFKVSVDKMVERVLSQPRKDFFAFSNKTYGKVLIKRDRLAPDYHVITVFRPGED